MTERKSRIRFSKDELKIIKEAKESEGLEELPHAAYLMRLIEERR